MVLSFTVAIHHPGVYLNLTYMLDVLGQAFRSQSPGEGVSPLRDWSRPWNMAVSENSELVAFHVFYHFP